MLFSACSEGTDYDIDYTPLAPIGGQYALNIEKVTILVRLMRNIGTLTLPMLKRYATFPMEFLVS